MRNLAVLVTLITMFRSAHSLNGVIQFFPTWTNCDNTSAIQFFDFYLDHKPSLKPNTLLGPSAITPNNFTLCANQGTNDTIGVINTIYRLDNKTVVSNTNDTDYSGKSFSQGLYSHCVQVNMSTLLVPGYYDLALNVISATNTSQTIGCLNANWELDVPVFAEIESFLEKTLI